MPLAPPVPRRRSLAKPFALAAGGAAVIAAAVFLGINVFNKDDHPNKFDDPVDQAVHEKILSGEFEDALQSDRRRQPCGGPRRATPARSRPRLVSEKRQVTRGSRRGRQGARRAGRPRPVVRHRPASRQLARKHRHRLVWRSRPPAQGQKYAEAAVLFNQIIARLGSFQDALRLRGEALDNLERSRQVAARQRHARRRRQPFRHHPSGRYGPKKINVDPASARLGSPPTRPARNVPALTPASKTGRKPPTTSSSFPRSWTRPRDSAHHEIIRLLANDKTASPLDARRVNEEFASAADPWENKALGGLLDRLNRAGEGNSSRRFAKAITDAEGSSRPTNSPTPPAFSTRSPRTPNKKRSPTPRAAGLRRASRSRAARPHRRRAGRGQAARRARRRSDRGSNLQQRRQPRSARPALSRACPPRDRARGREQPRSQTPRALDSGGARRSPRQKRTSKPIRPRPRTSPNCPASCKPR